VENKFIVGAQGNNIVVRLPLQTACMTKEEALNLAAWLVAMSTLDADKDFNPLLNELYNS